MYIPYLSKKKEDLLPLLQSPLQSEKKNRQHPRNISLVCHTSSAKAPDKKTALD